MIKIVPDFPRPGIQFLDITPFLLDPEEVKKALDALCAQVKAVADGEPVVIIGPEARGFIFGSMVAAKLEMPFFMLRKGGKLPNDGTQVEFSASKEYGSSVFQVNMADLDDLKARGLRKVVILDDVMATGHTNLAVADFFKAQGFEVALVMHLIEIVPLKGNDLYVKAGYPTYSYIKH